MNTNESRYGKNGTSIRLPWVIVLAFLMTIVAIGLSYNYAADHNRTCKIDDLEKYKVEKQDYIWDQDQLLKKLDRIDERTTVILQELATLKALRSPH